MRNPFQTQYTCVALLAVGCLSQIGAGISIAAGPSVESVRPVAGERGATFEVTLVGSGLQQAAEVLFYERGVECSSIEVVGDDELKLKLNVASDCALGLHAFRLRTQQGLSELRTFTITRNPITIAETTEGDNARGDQAFPIPRLDACVLGELRGVGTQYFTIVLQKGQPFAAEVEAIRLGVAMLDTSLVVRDPSNEIVAKCDDTSLYRQDPVLSFIPKESGEFTIELTDAGIARGDSSPYLLHVGSAPRPTHVFPLGGQAGTVIELTYSGDCLGDFTDTVALPLPTRNVYFAYPTRDGKLAATAIPIRVSPFPNVLEVEPNDHLELATSTTKPLAVPCAWNGVLSRPFDRDCCWVKVQKGQRLDLDVLATRLGSRVDSILTVVDENLAEIATSDDLETHDSHLVVDCPSDGLLGFVTEDKRGESGADFAYRVEITLATPTVETFLPRRDRLSQDRHTIDVPAGNRVLAFIGVRKDNQDGQVSIGFPQLPTGVQPFFRQPQSSDYVVPVVFEAAAEAPRAGALVPVEANMTSSQDSATGKFRQVVDLINGPADAIYQEWSTDRLAVSVIDPLPFSISTQPPQASLVRDGTLDVVVELDRQPGFESPVEIKVPWLPPWVDTESQIVIPANESTATIRLRSWGQVEEGSWPLVFEASVKPERRSRGSTEMIGSAADAPPAAISTATVASAPVTLVIDRPMANGTASHAAGETGQTIEFVCMLEQPLNARGQASSATNESWTATMEGLPKRVIAEPVKVDVLSREIRFQIVLEPTAPVGRYTGLACRLTGTVNGQGVSYIVARDGKLSIAAPGELVRDSSGRLLSRLEALRERTKTNK